MNDDLPGGQAALLRSTATMLAPPGRFGALLVLMYHRVLAAPDSILSDEPDARRFAAQMDLVRQLFNVLPLSEAVERLMTGRLPTRAAAITFDDGYANNLDIAAPILAARGMPATFFVATGFVRDGRMWNDTVIEAVRRAPDHLNLCDLGLGEHRLSDPACRRQAIDTLLGQLKYLEQPERLRQAEAIAAKVGATLPVRLMMDEKQLRSLAALGMEIGAHSVTHPILARLTPDEARREIRDSKGQLEEILSEPVRAFAYPNGQPGRDYGPEHVQMVREAGFTMSVSTAWGAASSRTDRLQIPRVAPWDRTPLRYGLRLVRAFAQRRPAVV